MTQNKNWVKIQIPQKVTLAILAESRNLPAHWARQLFRPSKASLHNSGSLKGQIININLLWAASLSHLDVEICSMKAHSK